MRGQTVAVAGREGAGGRGTDGTVGDPEGCLSAAASGPKAPALRTALSALALVRIGHVRIEAQGVLNSQQDA